MQDFQIITGDCRTALAGVPGKRVRPTATLLAARLDEVLAGLAAAQSEVVRLRQLLDFSRVAEAVSEQQAMLKVRAQVAMHYGFSLAQLLGRSRLGEVSAARQMAMLLMRETGATFSMIGRALGRDHGTVMSGVKSVQGRLATEPRLQRELEELRKLLALSPMIGSKH